MPFILPEAELRFRASRAGGPGGQHVNKTSTKIEVLWDITHSPSLSDAQRSRLQDKLGARIDDAGVLHVTAGRRRSQARNRDDAMARMEVLVNDALYEPPTRKRTRVPRQARETRMADKRKRAETKRRRQRPDPIDE